MILTGDEILRQYHRGLITLDPFNEHHLNPNSYDLTLAPVLATYRPQLRTPVRLDYTLDMAEEHAVDFTELSERGHLLEPGRVYLGLTNERCGSDQFVACLEGRSSVGRLGIQVHLTAGFGDLGFQSQWTLEISVVQPVIIYPHVRICQAIFYQVQGTIGTRLYRGKYQHQTRPTPSMLWKELQGKS